MSTQTPSEIALQQQREYDRWQRPTNKGGLEGLMPLVKLQMEKGLPAFMKGQSDRLLRCLITECSKSADLLACTPLSLFAACIQAGQLGLTIGGPMGEAYVLPFVKGGKKNAEGIAHAALVVGYKGFKELAFRTNQIRRISADVVRENDEFDFLKGTTEFLRHKPHPDWSKVKGYYCVVEFANGGTTFHYMNRKQIFDFRDQFAMAKSDSTPWGAVNPENGEPRHQFNEMAMKTCFRHLSKWIPQSPELALAAELDEQAERGVQMITPGALGIVIDGATIPAEEDAAPTTPRTAAEALKERMAGVETVTVTTTKEKEKVTVPPTSPPPAKKGGAWDGVNTEVLP